MSQITRYGISNILIIIGIVLFMASMVFYQSSAIKNEIDKPPPSREIFVLSHCTESFGNNSAAYLACVGQNLNAEEINSVIVSDLKTESNERGELAKAIRMTTGISIDDIKNHGILGGDNSEIRKVRKALFEQERSECLQLGVSSTSNDCSLYEELLSKLRQSSFFYNKPSKMTVGETVEIDLAVNPSNPEEAKAELRGLKGTATEGKGKIARHMSAELFGASFEVSPSGPQKRLVLDSNTTKWKWKVKPLKEGKEELLTLDIYVHLEVDGKTSAPITIKTYREKILVDVTAWDALKKSVSDWSPIIALVLTIVGAIWGAYSWLRGRKWRADADAK